MPRVIPRVIPRRFSISLVVLAVVAALSVGSPAAAAPVVTIVPQSALTGSITFSFDQPVRSIMLDNVVLRIRGKTTNLVSTIACTDSGGATASCGLGPVSHVVLKHAAPLVPGQLYSAIVNPSGASPVTDMLGGALPLTAKPFWASLIEQETSVAAAYSWRRVTDSHAYGGVYRTEHTKGARTSFVFTGANITWYTRTAADQGTATVLIDGRKIGVVDNYAPVNGWRVARRFRGLAGGRHTIVVIVDGRPGSTRSQGTFVTIDDWAPNGSIVNDTAKYRFATAPDAKASGGRIARSDLARTRASFTFRGKGIDWYTVTGPYQGKATISIDGVVRKTVDNYAPASHYNVRRGVAGLSDVVHTATITVMGTRNTASRGTYVVIDKWVVRIPPTVAFARLGAWVDLFDYGLTPSTATAKMASRGVKTLYLETARYNSSSAFDHPDAVGQWIEAAHANKMRIVGWYLPAYSEYLDKDVARTAAIAAFRSPAGQGFDALGIDIEYKGKTSSAAEFDSGITSHLARVRAAVGNAFPIGAIVPAPLAMELAPSHWTGFPWSSIGRYGDVVLPMSYWSYRTDCSTNVQHCAYQYTRGNAAKSRSYTGLPVHVIGGVADSVTSAQVSDFVRGARDEHAYGGSLYDYRTTSSSFWTSLAGLNSL